jgi:hypothetical protein
VRVRTQGIPAQENGGGGIRTQEALHAQRLWFGRVSAHLATGAGFRPRFRPLGSAEVGDLWRRPLLGGVVGAGLGAVVLEGSFEDSEPPENTAIPPLLTCR